MLTWLAEMEAKVSWLRIFQYVTFRAAAGGATAFALSLWFGRRMIAGLRRMHVGQEVRKGEEWKAIGHGGKQGTPTMGGLLILATAGVATLLWCDWGNAMVWLSLATLVYMGGVGFLDDWLKLKRHNSDGLSEKRKYVLEGLWAVAAFAWMESIPEVRAHLDTFYVPFRSAPLWVGVPWWVMMPWVWLVIVGTTNAVNLTDGLDGLAAGCYAPVNAAVVVMAYVAGHSVFAGYLRVPAVPGAHELAVFGGCLLGGVLGFLWWNAYPAKVFMGDTGALALGGAVAMVALLVKQELALAVAGAVFVVEALSVMIQRGACKAYRRRTGQTLPQEKRPFRMAPLHHHFEIVSKEHLKALGRSPDAAENSVVVRFWVVSALCAAAAVALLKVR
ncbi:MAG: phospho-N-acetylmuramoyl-pentapeptide-transferase [Kiritimatiellae bacterium]|nr:phospho-N-acetylmuramoyl-pentapeptide-transferase [Kiritimatiellia bacterium]